MNHDSGFIIGIADVFAKILIENTPKICLKSIHLLKTTLWWFFAMNKYQEKRNEYEQL